jgi:hypothetical protein
LRVHRPEDLGKFLSEREGRHAELAGSLDAIAALAARCRIRDDEIAAWLNAIEPAAVDGIAMDADLVRILFVMYEAVETARRAKALRRERRARRAGARALPATERQAEAAAK